jgi:hypothetical protein
MNCCTIPTVSPDLMWGLGIIAVILVLLWLKS